MAIWERLLLALATFLVCVGVFGSIIAVSWAFERLVGLNEGAAALATIFAAAFGMCFAMTFAPGAPRWFRKGDR